MFQLALTAEWIALFRVHLYFYTCFTDSKTMVMQQKQNRGTEEQNRENVPVETFVLLLLLC